MRRFLVVAVMVLLGVALLAGQKLFAPEPVLGQQEDACVLQYDKQVTPDDVNAGGIVSVTLSLQAGGDCSPVRSPVDVILVIDRSGSMRKKDGSGGTQTRMQNAKDAASAFVQRMDFSVDQVAIVSFAGTDSVRLDSELGQGKEESLQAIDDLRANGMTDIRRALEEAEMELTGSRHAPEHASVVILLSDGRHNESPLGELGSVAQRLHDEGIRVISIGVGSVDKDQLQSIASSAEDFYYAPSSDQLDTIYEDIAVKKLRWAARSMIVTDTLSSDVSLVSDSFSGSMQPASVNGDQEIVWEVGNVNTGEGTTLSYQVAMTDRAGTWETSDETVGTYIGPDITSQRLADAREHVSFPATEVTVNDLCGQPELQSVEPTWACSDQEFAVTLHGGGFFDDPLVHIGAESLSVQQSSAQEISANMGRGMAEGTYPVSVTNTCQVGPLSTSLADAFTVYDSPEVLEIDPYEGYGDKPTEVKICGNGMPPGAVASIEMVTGTVELMNQHMLDDRCLIGTIPSDLTPGRHTIKVESACGEGSGGYHVLEPALNDDLWSRVLWVNPSISFRQGEDVSVGLLVHRRGGKAPVQVTVSFYYDVISDTNKIGDGQIPLLSPRSDRTNPNGVSTSEVIWNVPELDEAQEYQEYTVYAVIDPDNTVPEDIEDNNVISQTVRLLPAGGEGVDGIAPRVTELVLNDDEETVYDSGDGEPPVLNIDVEAEDYAQPGADVSGINALYLVEYFFNDSVSQWVPVATSGWLTYTESVSMPLSARGGVRYIQAWTSDRQNNISRTPLQKQINYVRSCNEVARDGSQTYRTDLQQGDRLYVEVVVCDEGQGDPDLYIWPPDWSSDAEVSPWVSNLSGPEPEYRSFVAPQDGEYQVEVYGYLHTRYNIQIETEPGAGGVAVSDSDMLAGIDPSKPLRTAPAANNPDRSDYGPSMPSGSGPSVDARFGAAPPSLPPEVSLQPETDTDYYVYLPIARR